ncbi:MAG: hypothetical protein ACM3PZ_02425 [Bacillota bacterium]
MICLAGLILILAVSGGPVQKFYAFVLISMVVNFFCYQKKQNSWFFYLPVGAGCITMLFALLSFIGWLIGQPVFIGFWSKIFGLNAFIVSFASIFYALLLLDNDVRHAVGKKSFRKNVANA